MGGFLLYLRAMAVVRLPHRLVPWGKPTVVSWEQKPEARAADLSSAAAVTVSSQRVHKVFFFFHF